ncbi:unnamed protein product, partial [Rotaria magnacalcarata]
ATKRPRASPALSIVYIQFFTSFLRLQIKTLALLFLSFHQQQCCFNHSYAIIAHIYFGRYYRWWWSSHVFAVITRRRVLSMMIYVAIHRHDVVEPCFPSLSSLLSLSLSLSLSSSLSRDIRRRRRRLRQRSL